MCARNTFPAPFGLHRRYNCNGAGGPHRRPPESADDRGREPTGEPARSPAERPGQGRSVSAGHRSPRPGPCGTPGTPVRRAPTPRPLEREAGRRERLARHEIWARPGSGGVVANEHPHADAGPTTSCRGSLATASVQTSTAIGPTPVLVRTTASTRESMAHDRHALQTVVHVPTVSPSGPTLEPAERGGARCHANFECPTPSGRPSSDGSNGPCETGA